MNSLFIITISFLLFTIFWQPLISQNYEPGYVITLDGDSMRGSVLYKDHRFNRKNCKFRAEGESIDFSPGNIRAYGVDGVASFRSVERELRGNMEWVFAEYMLMGEPALLFYGSTYFVEKDNKVELLVSGSEIVTVDGKKLEKTSDEYKRQLLNLLNDCSDISGMVVQTEYNDKSLKKLFNAYYKCKGKSFAYQEDQRSGIIVNPGVSIRAGRITTSFERFIGSTYYFEQNDISWDQFLSPSFFIRISYPKINANLAIRVGIAWSSFTYTNSDVNDRAGIDLLYEMETKTSLIEVPINFVYSFRRLGGERLYPYVFAGGSMLIPVQFDGERKTTTPAGSVLSRNSFRKRTSFFAARAGLGADMRISKSLTTFVEFFYESSDDYAMSDDSQVLMYLKSLNASLGVYF